MRTLVTGGAGYIGMELVDELLNAGREVTGARRPAARPAGPRGGAAPPRREARRGRHPRPGSAREALDRTPRRSSTWRRSSATRPARWTRSWRTRSTSRPRSRSPPRPRGRRRALRDGQHLLELRPDGRPDDADRRDRRARARQPLRRAEGQRSSSTCSRRRRRTPSACASRPSTASRRGCASTSRSTSSPATCGRTATLEVFGEQFWRPYVHVRDAARGIRTVLRGRHEQVAGEVFNIGDTRENYRKLDLVEEIRKQTDRGTVSYVAATEDPRDYKVGFEQGPRDARLRGHADRAGRHRRGPAGARRGPLPRRLRPPVPQHPVTCTRS